MSTQQTLLYSYLAEDFKNQQNRLKQIKDKLLAECQILDHKIGKQLQRIKETSRLINQGAQIQTKIYNDSLNSDNYSPQVIDLNTLSKYLKKEKAYLTEIISDENQNNKKPKSGKDLLHKLSNRKKFQKYLQNLECYKLQKEIEYLQKNILVGQSRQGQQNIIYEDIESVTLKEENQQIQKLKISISELQRMVSLSNQCGGNKNDELSNKAAQLHKQTERLQSIQQLLDRQTKEIVQVKDFFKDYEPKQIIDFLNQNINPFEKGQSSNLSNQQEASIINLDKDEINCILQFDAQVSNMKIFKKPFQQVNDLVKTCKNKLKKLKI